MFFTVLFFTMFIAADCSLRKNDGKVESNECKDTNIHCATWKHLCHAGPDFKPVIEMCKETCGLCKASTMCPAGHPFAYFNGRLCCRVNKEDIYLPSGSDCDGSELSPASVCCKDHMVIKCPHTKCATNTVSMCPIDHPFAYFKGTYCCKTNKERVDPQLGSYCDGSEISSSSMCCKDNKYIACPHGKCVTSTVDPCTVKNGGCTHICKNKGQAVTCSCKDGFELKTNGKTCVRIDPCKIKNGGCTHICKSNGQAVTCSCKDGFNLKTDGKTCVIDPCTIKNGGCTHICKSKGLAVTCSCKDGFKLKTDEKTCVRIDPCTIKNGGCTHICKSNGKAVTCSCKDGFRLKKDGKTCLTPDALCKSAKVIGNQIEMGKQATIRREHQLMCGSRITGFRIKADRDSIIGIQLKCSDGMETKTTVGWSHTGSWKPWKVCTGEKTSVKRVNYRRKDEGTFTVGTNIKMQCSDDTVLDGGGPTLYDWEVTGFKKCPWNQYYCGIRTWFLDVLYKLQFTCCECEYF